MGTALAAGLGSVALPLEAGGKKGISSETVSAGLFPGRARRDFLADCRRQLFGDYLPFWENGGHDAKFGGFMCSLHEDGTVENERKDIWYQGRGIWVYAYLYNEIDKDPKWLERARLARDFMVPHMHNGDGTWKTTVDRIGKPVEGIEIMRSDNIYGALFAAAGLIQYAKATGNERDLDLARMSLRKSIGRYERDDYPGVSSLFTERDGLRSQGHAFMLVWVIPQLLELADDPSLRVTLAEQLDALEHRFWNPEYGISNEILFHDYSRIPGEAEQMVPGHSIEAQWMGMNAVHLSGGETARVNLFAKRMRRLIEMSWDHVFDGTCDTAYHVFATGKHPAGPVLETKTMWAQTEVVIGSLMAWEHTREAWARDWFERSWSYLQRTMTTPYGVWRQAVDRQGRDKQREGISPYRRGNFHQPRCLMYLIRRIERIIGEDSVKPL